jgi:hypothetical protein
MSWLLFMDESGHSHKELPYDTKSSLLLDFRRGAQRVPPVCFGMLLGSNGNGWRASREDRPLDNSYFCECRFLGAGDDMKQPKNANAAPRTAS